MEIVQDNIYNYPEYYDLVYGSDWKAEFDFLSAAIEKFCDRRALRLFEPACGTGRLVYRFAKAGFDVSGLDLNEKAIEFCNKRLKCHKLPETSFVADMCDFQLAEPAGFAFNTINSFRHLPNEQLALDHLNCMSKSMTEGGIYALGLHLSPTEGEAVDNESWVARRGELQVNTQMQLSERNMKKRVEHFSMCFDVYTSEKFFQIQDTLSFRTYSAKQFAQLIDKSPFEIAATFDFSYEIDEPIDVGPESEDVVYLLRNAI